jgi:colanic acid/amylovoran biosynthesis glycosyltransferase
LRPLHARFVAYDWRSHISGPGTWLSGLLPALQSRGLRCSVDVLYWDEPGPLEGSLRDAGIQLTSNPINGTASERVRGILERAAKDPVDVFVPNLAVPAFHAARWVRRSGIPTVGVLHSDDSFYGGLLDVFVAGRKCDAVSCIVAVSETLEQRATVAVRSETEVIRIPYGVSSPPTQERTKEGSGLTIAYVGRLAEQQKRISLVAKAMLRIVSEIPGCTAKIIGDGPDVGIVQSILQTTPDGAQVQLTGRLDSKEVLEALVSSHILLLLSDYEGLPIALLEGMSCGAVPVVSDMRSGIPELVRHGVNGLIVADRANAVVNAVQQLNLDRTLLTRLSIAARKTILDGYTHELCASQWESLIRRLAQLKRDNKELLLPRCFDLPQQHPALATEDPREVKRSRLAGILKASRRFVRSLLRPNNTEL